LDVFLFEACIAHVGEAEVDTIFWHGVSFYGGKDRAFLIEN
jgi:hypothetical protein